jgi:hypothetical protein
MPRRREEVFKVFWTSNPGERLTSELINCRDCPELLPELADFLRRAADDFDQLFTEAIDQALSDTTWE